MTTFCISEGKGRRAGIGINSVFERIIELKIPYSKHARRAPSIEQYHNENKVDPPL